MPEMYQCEPPRNAYVCYSAYFRSHYSYLLNVAIDIFNAETGDYWHTREFV